MSFVVSIRIGAILAAIAVAIGAFTAHLLKDKLTPDLLEIMKTGATYQFYHSIAILLVGVLQLVANRKHLSLISSFFFAGILLFSGSLYALVYIKYAELIAWQKIGIVTPIGGLCFLAGWLGLAFLYSSQNEK